jgi:hypothetical protein
MIMSLFMGFPRVQCLLKWQLSCCHRRVLFPRVNKAIEHLSYCFNIKVELAKRQSLILDASPAEC